ncbi:hypothetical protein OAI19_00685 [Porticoccaceae bacterium]|nr:hypothetical protein [Porticoccaceae bacterium]
MTKQTPFEQDIKNDLLDAEQAMSAPEIFRLAQARNMAITQSKRKMPKILWRTLGASCVSILLAGVLLNGQTGNHISTSGLDWKVATGVNSGVNSAENSKVNSDVSIGINNALDSSLANEATSDEALYLYEDLELDYWLADADMDGTS